MLRMCGIRVTPELIGEFCRNGERHFTVNGPLPESAAFRSAYYDYVKDTFVCFFEDESFEPVVEGDAIPIVPSPWIITQKEHV